MSIRRLYRVSNMGAVSPVDGLDKSTILSVSAVLEISWPGGHLDLASDDNINVDVAWSHKRFGTPSRARRYRRSQVYRQSLDVPDSSRAESRARCRSR